MDEGRQFPSPCRDGTEGINLQGTFLWAFNIHPPLLRVGEIAACVAALSSKGIWGGSDLWRGTAKRKRQMGREDHAQLCASHASSGLHRGNSQLCAS